MKFQIKFFFALFLCFLFSNCKNSSIEPILDESIGHTEIGVPAKSLGEFEQTLNRIREDLKIPGMTAAIVKDQKIVWTNGFGYANKEDKIPASSNTIYHLASLTKPFASMVIMKLVEENKINIDLPVTHYGLKIENADKILVRHLLTHTSEGSPGYNYSYNGNRFGYLDSIIYNITGKTFIELLNKYIVQPLSLSNTFPYPLSGNHEYSVSEAQLKNIAVGYSSNGQNVVEYSTYFGTSAGLMSTVHDLAKFSAAIDNNELISANLKSEMFSPYINPDGKELAYALGWFIDNNQEKTVFWHYGWWTGISSLILKVPSEGLDFILLANSDMLSRVCKGIGINENIEVSIPAMEFLNAFVYGDIRL